MGASTPSAVAMSSAAGVVTTPSATCPSNDSSGLIEREAVAKRNADSVVASHIAVARHHEVADACVAREGGRVSAGGNAKADNLPPVLW